MNPEEIRTIIQTTIEGKIKYFWVYVLLSGLLAIIGAYSIEFFKNKGKNLATKQDIEDVTRKIEEVKAEIYSQQEVEKQKRELKFKALLSALTLIDAQFSQTLDSKGQKIRKQYATIEEARRCHNSLILTCDYPETIEMFSLIMFGPKDKDTEPDPPILLLNEFRKIIRKELGFGSEFNIDEDRSWFLYGAFEKE